MATTTTETWACHCGAVFSNASGYNAHKAAHQPKPGTGVWTGMHGIAAKPW